MTETAHVDFSDVNVIRQGLGSFGPEIIAERGLSWARQSGSRRALAQSQVKDAAKVGAAIAHYAVNNDAMAFAESPR